MDAPLGRNFQELLPEASFRALIDGEIEQEAGVCQLKSGVRLMVRHLPARDSRGAIQGIVSHAIYEELRDAPGLASRLFSSGAYVGNGNTRFRLNYDIIHTFDSWASDCDFIDRLQRPLYSCRLQRHFYWPHGSGPFWHRRGKSRMA